MEEMEGLEDEEGPTCMVCQEGYSFKPDEVLGVYVYSTKVKVPNVDATEGKGMASSASASAGASSSMSMDPLDIPAELLDLHPRSSRQSSAMLVTSVSAFNTIHFSCHDEAARADRALSKPKSEFEGATLRNSRCRCNSILPIHGPEVEPEAYAMAVERHFASVGNDAGSSKFRLLAHDVRLLALRIAHQENLRDEAGGGSLSSNIKLLSFQVRLGVHLHTSGHIEQETAQFRKLLDGLAAVAAEEDSSLREAAPFMMVLSLFFSSKEEWQTHKLAFVEKCLRMPPSTGSGVIGPSRKRSHTPIPIAAVTRHSRTHTPTHSHPIPPAHTRAHTTHTHATPPHTGLGRAVSHRPLESDLDLTGVGCESQFQQKPSDFYW